MLCKLSSSKNLVDLFILFTHLLRRLGQNQVVFYGTSAWDPTVKIWYRTRVALCSNLSLFKNIFNGNDSQVILIFFFLNSYTGGAGLSYWIGTAVPTCKQEHVSIRNSYEKNATLTFSIEISKWPIKTGWWYNMKLLRMRSFWNISFFCVTTDGSLTQVLFWNFFFFF